MNGIAQTDGEQRLAAVLEHINDAPRGGLQEDVAAVGEQVVFGPGGDDLDQALAQLFLQESDNLAHALQAEATAAQLADHGDLGNVVEGVEAAVAFAGGRDDATFIPPL